MNVDCRNLKSFMYSIRIHIYRRKRKVIFALRVLAEAMKKFSAIRSCFIAVPSICWGPLFHMYIKQYSTAWITLKSKKSPFLKCKHIVAFGLNWKMTVWFRWLCRNVNVFTYRAIHGKKQGHRALLMNRCSSLVLP